MFMKSGTRRGFTLRLRFRNYWQLQKAHCDPMLDPGLEYGGAEMMLYKFLSRINKTRFTAQAILMIDLGPFGRRIQSWVCLYLSWDAPGKSQSDWPPTACSLASPKPT